MGSHYPVMLQEAVDALDVVPGGVYVDCTLGRGGHSSLILEKLQGKGRLYCFDLDEEAMKESRQRLLQAGDNFTLIHGNFAFLKQRMQEEGVGEVDGILADLGVSSPQFDEAERGFSYKEDAPLDMRMDQTQAYSAFELVNQTPEKELAEIFYQYGEDPYSGKIARSIALERKKKAIRTTGELVEIIKRSKPEKELRKKGHPAKQIFQAIRIAVNGEEDALKTLLRDGPDLLRHGGRLAIITFMSLDDRLVKREFQRRAIAKVDRHQISLPGEEEMPYRILTPKPILPSQKELEENHRSASAKLRVLERK